MHGKPARGLISRSLFAVLLLSAVRLCAQAIFGTIYGQVTDPSGAVIPNATITVTDVAKGTSVKVKSDSNGEYTVGHLIPDTYNVSVTAQGFRTLSNNNITVAADTAPKIDLKLEVGSATETVEVTTEVPQLKADRADVATLFNEKTVTDLPIVGRNFTSLELLIPGSQQMGWTQNAAENPQGSAQVQINGQHFSGVAYELDGAANQDPILGQIVINPTLDGVSEVKIATQNYDAEFGQAVAAVMTAQTKSGTNAFHGDVFDFRRSDANLARNPFTQAVPDTVTGRYVPAAIYSQFGGSIGGPILHSKLFFFGDYQGVRQKTGGSTRVTVPTLLMHNTCTSGGDCNLSEYLDPNIGRGAQGQIYNPRSVTAATPVPAAFAGNIIPAALVSPQAVALLKLIPLPNGPGLVNNYTAGGSGVTNNDQFDVRIDDQVSDRTHAFGRYSFFNNKNSGPVVFGAAGGAGLTGFGGSAAARNQSAIAGADVALSNKLVTDFRLGYLRYHVATSKFDGTTPLATQLGIPGLNLASSFTSGSPAFYAQDASGNNGDGLSPAGSGLNVNGCNCSLLETEDQDQVVNNWTRTLGTHSVKFGLDLRYGRNLRVPSDSNRAGELSFSASDTENLSAPVAGGVGFATLMLGDVTNLSRYVSSSTNAKESQKRIYSYVEDSWRVTPNLTVNYGLRYEFYFPETVNGKGNGGFADLNTGTIRVAGYGPYATDLNVQKTWKTFAPRVGVTYQTTPSTVVRAGYGRSFDIGVFGSIFGHVLTQNLPVLANQNLTNAGPDTAAFNLAQGPAAFAFPAIPANGQIPIPDGLSAKFRNDPNQFPTLDAWNLAVQQQVGKTLSVTMAYVGNKGSHTFAGDGQTTNPNTPVDCISAAQSVTGQQLCYNSGGANSTTNTNELKPYFKQFGWTQGLTYYHNGFDTHYNALQVTVEKRFAQGLQFTANYAWQRAFNYNGNFVESDRRVTYGRYDDLREQQFTLFGNYQLPFGRNRMFFRNMNGVLNAVFGGYELSTSINLSGGLPFTPTYNGTECGDDTLSGQCMPDKLGGERLPLSLGGFDPISRNRVYFTPVAALTNNGTISGPFRRPQVDQQGTVGRNNYFGPSFFNADMSLIKDIPIWEHLTGQLRVNAFNVFNHINAANPNSCIDCTVGQNAGLITGMATGAQPRQLEFSGRIQF